MSRPILDVIIPGPPQGYQRPGVRVIRAKSGATFAQHYEQGKTRSWRSVAVGIFAPEGRPLTCVVDRAVRVTIEAVGQRPKSILKREGVGRLWRRTKPDVDNVSKSVLDALTTSGVLRDVDLVAELVARSYVAAEGEAPHVRVRVELLEALPVVEGARARGAAGALL